MHAELLHQILGTKLLHTFWAFMLYYRWHFVVLFALLFLFVGAAFLEDEGKKNASDFALCLRSAVMTLFIAALIVIAVFVHEQHPASNDDAEATFKAAQQVAQTLKNRIDAKTPVPEGCWPALQSLVDAMDDYELTTFESKVISDSLDVCLRKLDCQAKLAEVMKTVGTERLKGTSFQAEVAHAKSTPYQVALIRRVLGYTTSGAGR